MPQRAGALTFNKDNISIQKLLHKTINAYVHSHMIFVSFIVCFCSPLMKMSKLRLLSHAQTLSTTLSSKEGLFLHISWSWDSAHSWLVARKHSCVKLTIEYKSFSGPSAHCRRKQEKESDHALLNTDIQSAAGMIPITLK